jgi:hypothetical protein
MRCLWCQLVWTGTKNSIYDIGHLIGPIRKINFLKIIKNIEPRSKLVGPKYSPALPPPHPDPRRPSSGCRRHPPCRRRWPAHHLLNPPLPQRVDVGRTTRAVMEERRGCHRWGQQAPSSTRWRTGRHEKRGRRRWHCERARQRTAAQPTL